MQTHQVKALHVLPVALLTALLCALLFSGTSSPAPAVNAFTLPWWTLDSGGASFLQSGDYSLGVTAGQPDAAHARLSGAYRLQSGFWIAEAQPPEIQIYLPIIQR